MKKILVYSHDTYGLGNLRRMLTICQSLSRAIPDVSILLLSGSPMVQSFRLTDGLDYIKLPCLTRVAREGYAVKSLRLGIVEGIKLRSDLMLAAARNFQPDLLLVDKKPFGIKNELKATLEYLKATAPHLKVALILRDILDTPESTVSVWKSHDYFRVIEEFYDLVLSLGVPEIFDPRHEYQFPDTVANKVKFCGYLRREAGSKSRAEVRQELGLSEQEQLVVVTLGGGEDAFAAIATYLQGIANLPTNHNIHSLIVTGPEMKEAQQQALCQAIPPHVTMMEFTNDLMSYLGAADVVVSMGGYNTVCEILSLQKKAIVIPRVRPVQEQLIRAERMSRRGFFQYLHPDTLTAENLMQTLHAELNRTPGALPPLNLNAHQAIAQHVTSLLLTE
ncbi:MAG TPA: glycosyltransferase [Blastocatellia bacterium]|nr:glycosyltransferase [Blastocatellia bacterium]